MGELRLENASYRYKNSEHLAVNDVSCIFGPGAVHAIVGPSGSGKSTLLSLLAGLDHPTSGRVTMDGDDLEGLDLDQYRRERVSMIFQAFQLFPLLTAMENAAFPLEMRGLQKAEARGRAKELLASVGIDDEKCGRFPSNLSGGEQQRVAIARALSTGAQILLADEPTGNLDAENGRRVMEILHRLAHEQNYCVIVVTHDTGIAADADQTFRMCDGRLEQGEGVR